MSQTVSNGVSSLKIRVSKPQKGLIMAKKGVCVKTSGISGVYYDESSVKKFGRRADRHFYYRFKHKQSTYKEYVGWESDGVTAQDADEKKAEHKKSMNSTSIVYPRNITFKEIGDFFFVQKKDLESIMGEVYRYKRLEPLYDMPVDAISIIELNSIKDTMLADGNSNQTVNHLFSLFNRIINLAIDAKKLQHSPCKPRHLKVPPRPMEKLDDEEQARYMNILFQYPDRTAAQPLALAYFTGIRRGDICRLTAEDFHPKTQSIWLSKPKDGIPKFLPINDMAVQIILQQPMFEHGFMFSNKYGNPLAKEILTRFGNEIKKAAGITARNFRPVHGLRHNYATMLAKSGKLAPLQIQRLMTHKNFSTTERYLDIAASDMEESVKKTDDILMGNYQQQEDIIQLTKVKVG